MTVEVEGVDYSPEGIEQIRGELVEHRNHALTLGEMRYAVLMSHVVVLLARLKEYEEGTIEKPIRVEAGKRATPPPKTRPTSGLPTLPPMQGGG